MAPLTRTSIKREMNSLSNCGQEGLAFDRQLNRFTRQTRLNSVFD